jgi:hypothetical protein
MVDLQLTKSTKSHNPAPEAAHTGRDGENPRRAIGVGRDGENPRRAIGVSSFLSKNQLTPILSDTNSFPRALR